jgi:hypothetical protein
VMIQEPASETKLCSPETLWFPQAFVEPHMGEYTFCRTQHKLLE